jgi:serine/threonine protein kinase
MKKTVGNFTYSEDDEIGRGSFSRVYQGHAINEAQVAATGATVVAIKVIELPKTDARMKHMLREIELMRHMHHENIVSLIDIKYEPYGHRGTRLFIVMEYCGGGDMSSLEKPMEESRCQHYFHGIFSGLRYLRKRRIIHRDIKPQNILITADNQVKIADFTFSKQVEENELMMTQCGTPLYISPDVMFGQPYTDKADLYSCGVMLYTFLYGNHPLGTVKTQAELAQKMKRAKITYPQRLVMESYRPPGGRGSAGEECSSLGGVGGLTRIVRTFSPEVIHLTKGLLKFNSSERISWDEIYSDPWLALEPFDPADQFVDDHHEIVHAVSAPVFSNTALVPLPKSTTKPLSITPPTTTADSPPVSSSFEQFEMSDGPPTGQSESLERQSRLIMDYSRTTNTAPQQPPLKERKQSGSFLTRSIDAIHKVFSL